MSSEHSFILLVITAGCRKAPVLSLDYMLPSYEPQTEPKAVNVPKPESLEPLQSEDDYAPLSGGGWDYHEDEDHAKLARMS